jgi:predicted transcriptional regulator
MIETSTEKCRYYLGFMLKPDKGKQINETSATPQNRIKAILADLNALEIIKPSEKKHAISDKNEYWTLTTEGRKLFKEVRREVLDKNLAISINTDEEEIIENKSTN